MPSDSSPPWQCKIYPHRHAHSPPCGTSLAESVAVVWAVSVRVEGCALDVVLGCISSRSLFSRHANKENQYHIVTSSHPQCSLPIAWFGVVFPLCFYHSVLSHVHQERSKHQYVPCCGKHAVMNEGGMNKSKNLVSRMLPNANKFHQMLAIVHATIYSPISGSLKVSRARVITFYLPQWVA